MGLISARLSLVRSTKLARPVLPLLALHADPLLGRDCRCALRARGDPSAAGPHRFGRGQRRRALPSPLATASRPRPNCSIVVFPGGGSSAVQTVVIVGALAPIHTPSHAVYPRRTRSAFPSHPASRKPLRYASNVTASSLPIVSGSDSNSNVLDPINQNRSPPERANPAPRPVHRDDLVGSIHARPDEEIAALVIEV